MSGLLNQWLTLQNQGQNYSTGEGDGAGPQTDFMKLFGGAADQYETAQRFGYTGAMPVQSYTDASEFQQGNPQQELIDWMQSSGYGYGINPTFNGGQINAWLDPQGNEIEGTRREFAAPDDSDFWLAANLAAAAVTGPMLAANLGSVGAGAVLGGASGFGNDMSVKDGIKGAVLGAAGAYAGGAAKDLLGPYMGAPDAMTDYMRTGAAEGSTIGNSLTGAGGQAGAVGAGSIAGQMAIPADFGPASLFEGMADPTKALEPLGDVFQMPGEMPSPMAPAVMPQADPYAQSVDITAPKLPFEPMPTMEVPKFAPESLFKDMADPTKALQPLPDMAPMPGPMPAAKTGNAMMDWLKANPKLASRLVTLAGGVLGGVGSSSGGGGGAGQTYSGPAKTWNSSLQMGGQASQPWRPTITNPAPIQARAPFGAGRYFGGT